MTNRIDRQDEDVVDRKAGDESVDRAIAAGDDLPGEKLANADLGDPGPYEIASDETDAEELTDEAPESDADVEIDDPDQLSDAEDGARGASGTEPETLAAAVRQSRPQRKSPDVAKKGAATPSRTRAKRVTASRRTTPAQFAAQSVEELKKVVWPTGAQVRQYFWVVLVFVLFIMAYVVTLDTGFGALLLKLFG